MDWRQIDGGTALRCDLCGEQIGKYFGDPPNPKLVTSRCFACAADEEASAITRASAGPPTLEDLFGDG
jgi:hypothetical protein